MPKTALAFESYLSNTKADAVFILGDLFEAWVGDDMRLMPFEARCTHALAKAGHRLWLGLMVGNRDFLLGQEMLTACAAHFLDDPTRLSIFGQHFLLTHGDAWCLNDTAYLKFRDEIRQPVWAQKFLAQTLNERLELAQKMRESSQAAQKKMDSIADVDAELAEHWLKKHQAQILIHGHTHRPVSQPFTAAGHWRHVLSEWNMDAPHEHGATTPRQILRLSSSGLQRLSWDEVIDPMPH